MALHQMKVVREFIAAISSMLKLACSSGPQRFAGLLFLELGGGLVPPATVWLTKVLFDLLAEGVRAGATATLPPGLLLLLAAQAGLAFVSLLSGTVSAYLNAELERQLTLDVRLTIYRKINSLTGLAPFEDSRFHDTIQLAAQGAQRGPAQILRTLTTLARSSITLAAFLGVLLSFSPLLAMVVGLSILPPAVCTSATGTPTLRCRRWK